MKGRGWGGKGWGGRGGREGDSFGLGPVPLLFWIYTPMGLGLGQVGSRPYAVYDPCTHVCELIFDLTE